MNGNELLDRIYNDYTDKDKSWNEDHIAESAQAHMHELDNNNFDSMIEDLYLYRCMDVLAIIVKDIKIPLAEIYNSPKHGRRVQQAVENWCKLLDFADKNNIEIDRYSSAEGWFYLVNNYALLAMMDGEPVVNLRIGYKYNKKDKWLKILKDTGCNDEELRVAAEQLNKLPGSGTRDIYFTLPIDDPDAIHLVNIGKKWVAAEKLIRAGKLQREAPEVYNIAKANSDIFNPSFSNITNDIYLLEPTDIPGTKLNIRAFSFFSSNKVIVFEIHTKSTDAKEFLTDLKKIGFTKADKEKWKVRAKNGTGGSSAVIIIPVTDKATLDYAIDMTRKLL